MGVVREIDGAHLDHRVVVDEVIQALRAHEERGDELASIALLAGAGDRAGLHEIHDRVAEHLGVDPEVAPVAELERRGSRDGADPELEGGAVGNELGDKRADAPLDHADRRLMELIRRLVGLHREVDLVDMDEAVAEGPRHRPVELDDDRPGGSDRGMHRLDRCPERAEAVLVRRRGIDEGHIERKRAGPKEARNIRQEHGHVVRSAVVHRHSCVWPDEQGAVAERSKQRRAPGGDPGPRCGGG